MIELCDKQITIQQNLGVPDGRGGTPENWITKYSKVNARIQPLSASERVQWGALAADISHTIYIANGALDVKPSERIVWDSRTFKILGVRNIDELDEFLTVTVRELKTEE